MNTLLFLAIRKKHGTPEFLSRPKSSLAGDLNLTCSVLYNVPNLEFSKVSEVGEN